MSDDQDPVVCPNCELPLDVEPENWEAEAVLCPFCDVSFELRNELWPTLPLERIAAKAFDESRDLIEPEGLRMVVDEHKGARRLRRFGSLGLPVLTVMFHERIVEVRRFLASRRIELETILVFIPFQTIWTELGAHGQPRRTEWAVAALTHEGLGINLFPVESWDVGRFMARRLNELLKKSRGATPYRG